MLPARINLVIFGVADVAASRRFYERLGFVASGFENEDVAFFDMNGTILGIYGRRPLAQDAGICDAGEGFRAVSLALNLENKETVDRALGCAESCGGKLVQQAREVFLGGGCSRYLAKPDGHLWEVAYNPIFKLDENGRLPLPPPSG